MLDWNEKAPLLDVKLDPKHVTQRTMAGRTLDYIEGWHAIAEANRIFGYGEWSFEVGELMLLSKDLVDGKYGKQWRVCYSCTAMFRVGDVCRQDVGFGQGQAKPEDLGAALESAGKEAVTDAMKRCLRTFGNPFGLALYDKSKANVGVGPSVEAQREAFRGSLGPPTKEPPKDRDFRQVNAKLESQREALPPYDPETGEISQRHNHGSVIRTAWEDGIRDGLPVGYTERQFYSACTTQIATQLRGYKTLDGLNGGWGTHEGILERMRLEANDLYETLFAVYSEISKALTDAPKPTRATPLTQAEGLKIIDTLGLCEDERAIDEYLAQLEPYARNHQRVVAAANTRRMVVNETYAG